MHKIIALFAAALALAGCASVHQLDNEVSSYSQWPAARRPTTYTFERLPSQQAQPQVQQALEDAARPALEAAGFKPAPDAAAADVSVQLGARVFANERLPYYDPFWWGGGGHWGRGMWGPPFWGPGFGMYYGTQGYEREVMILIRDRRSGQPLYEARASNDGLSASLAGFLPAMFEAALKDFPSGGVNPRRITVPLQPAS